MGKGIATRSHIVAKASDLATRVGLGGLSIGSLASEIGMSKSGLFAHFGSKEALQIQVLEGEAERFKELVIRPALSSPPGEPRIRALFERWFDWDTQTNRKGCLFVQSASELDDQPGPVRDVLEQQQRDWMDFLAEAARRAKGEGHFASGSDSRQFAFEFNALAMGFHHAARMMRDVDAEKRVRTAFATLLDRHRA